MMRQATISAGVLAVVLGVAANLAMSGASVPKDGELASPRDYTSWPVFLKEVQKPDAIRDL